jgi:ankyrin repeat protein
MELIVGEKRSLQDTPDSASSEKRLKVDNDIWKSIHADGLDIKALYQYIKTKGDVHAINGQGYSLLYLAALNRSTEAIRILLLQPNMDVNFSNGPHNELALHAAAAAGEFDAVELLLENGSQVDSKDSLGHTPLTNALLAVSLNCVKCLLETEKIDYLGQDVSGNSLLHLAVIKDFAEAIPLLLEKGVSVDGPNKRGLSPLAVAISLGYLNSAKALITGGADVNGESRFQSVLHYAINWNRIDVVKLLVDNMCTVNVVNQLDETPLYLAVQQRKIDLVRYLIKEAQADPCYLPSSPTSGNLPLLYAANHGYTEICDLVITPNTSTYLIESAAAMSRRAGQLGTEKFLLDAVAKRQVAQDVATTPNIENSNVDFGELFNAFSDDEETA